MRQSNDGALFSHETIIDSDIQEDSADIGHTELSPSENYENGKDNVQDLGDTILSGQYDDA